MTVKDPKGDIDLRSPQEIAEDERVSRLLETLSSLQAGNRVIIERLRPSWCKGQLETLTVGPEGLDLEYLIRTWGGDVLSLKVLNEHGKMTGSITVELYSWPTRRLGKIIKDPKFQEEEETPATPAPAPATQPPAPSPSPLGEGPDHFMRMLELLNQQRQSEVDTLRTLLMQQIQNQQALPPAPAPAPGNGSSSIREMVQMFKAFGELRELVQGDVSTGGDPTEQLPGQIMNIAQMFLQQKANEPKPTLTGPARRAAPPARIIPPVPPAAALSGGVPIPQEGANITPLRSPEDLAGQLSTLPYRDAANTLIEALAKMSPGKRDQTIASFMEEFNRTMAGEDDRFYTEDEYEEDGAAEDDNRGVETKTTG